jgi:hypothetical protein
MLIRVFRYNGGLVIFAALALGVVVIRACLQSITLDEAGTVLSYALKPWPSHWWPASDNHVLNSILIRLSVSVFGVSNLTVRLPAIAGALIYIVSTLYLCSLLDGRGILKFCAAAALLYNPMILDYLVAARGYSLAIGLFLAALGIIASTILTDVGDRGVYEKAVWISIVLALSSAANFSFAIADGVTLVVFVLVMRRQRHFSVRQSLRLAVYSFLPGLFVGFLLCGSVILKWPRGELYFGSKSMAEMWSGLASGSFDSLNPDLVNPLVLSWMNSIRGVVPYVVAAIGVSLFISIELLRWRRPKEQPERMGDLVRTLVVVAGTTLLLHWLAFKILHIPLPKDRTGLFFIPLWTVAVVCCVILAFESESWRIVRWSGVALLLFTGAYFVGCLRLSYFKEWKFDSDTKTLYWIMDDLHRRCGADRFGIDWRYHLALNFYREAYGNYSMKEFSSSTSGELPTDRAVYAIFLPTSEEFIREQKLQVIYHNEDSDAAVAIRSCEPRAQSH